MATLAFMLIPGGLPQAALDLGTREAQADDDPIIPPLPPIEVPGLPTPGGSSGAGNAGGSGGSGGDTGTTLPGGTVRTGTGIPNPGGGTSDSNNTAVALSASIGGGESAVYFFDTVRQRLLVYQYKGSVNGNRPLRPSDRGGLRLLAARHMDYDLRLEGYRDLSERTREELREAWEKAYGVGKDGKGALPTRKVSAK